MSPHVCVIGAGIVGAATALELLRDGCRVTIVEPERPGGTQATSYGNGAWISPASVVPMSMPGLWRKVPGYLLDPLAPLTIRWRHLPALAPWLIRFLLAGATVPRVERTARLIASLLADAPQRHAALAAEIGQPDLIRRTGLLYCYPDRAAFEAESLAWRLRRDNGLSWLELGADELRQREPALARHYTFGVLVESGAHCRDPGAYVAAVVAQALAQGAELRQARATGFSVVAGRLRAVTTNDGEIACDRAVIAAGIHSKALARAAGNGVSLETERGYHVEIAEPAVTPRIPIMPSDGKMANTLTANGLRAAGQVELASLDAAPDWRRADVLLGHLNRAYPELRAAAADRRWMGHRPSTPDGIPVIGPAAATPDIVHAFGHGHIGLATGPITGRLAADLVLGKTPSVDLAPFGAGRF